MDRMLYFDGDNLVKLLLKTISDAEDVKSGKHQSCRLISQP